MSGHSQNLYSRTYASGFFQQDKKDNRQACGIILGYFFAEVAMEWWVIAVELGVPAIIGLALYLTLRK